MRTRRAVMTALAGTLAGLAAPGPVGHAQESRLAARTVRLIVPFPPGSTPDAIARLLAPGLQQRLGGLFVVENTSGASGNLGMDRVAKAAPDGLTLGMGTNGPLAVNPSLYLRMPYAPQKDLTPIALLVSAPQVLVVRQDFPADTFSEFVAIVRKSPGKHAYGSIGSGSASHLTMELIKQERRLFLTHVPYRGSPQAVTDLLGGQIDAMVSIVPGVIQHVRSGKLKALAVTSARRVADLPQLPTLADAGLKGFDATTWIGLVGPTGLPPELVERLAAESAAVMQRDEVRRRLEAQGYEITVGSPQEFAAFIRRETDKWGAAVKFSGATVD